MIIIGIDNSMIVRFWYSFPHSSCPLPNSLKPASLRSVIMQPWPHLIFFYLGVHTETRRRGTIKWIQGTHKHYVNKCLDWPPNQQSDMRFHKEVTLPTTRSFVPVFVLIHHPPQPFMMWTVWFLIPNLYIRPLLLVHHLQSSQFSLPDWSLQATTADRARILGHPISHPWCLLSIRSPKSRSFFLSGIIEI